MTHDPIPVGRIDLGPTEPRAPTTHEQRVMDAVLRLDRAHRDARDSQVEALRAENERLRHIATEATRYRTAHDSLAFLAKIARGLGFENRRTESNQEMIGRALRELAEGKRT